MSRFVPPLARAMLMLAPALLAGCTTVGPDWHGAPAVAPDAGARGHFLRGPAIAEAPPAHWWTVLGDPVLDDLENRTLAGSPDLAAARARIDSARAALSSSRTSLLPQASVGALAGEASLPASLLGRNGRLSEQVYADNVQASWELDLFGATRRRIEAAVDRAAAAEASAADVAVALSGEVARVYVALRAQQASVALLTAQVDCDRKLLGLAQGRFAAGTVAEQAVDSARTNLAQSESDLADARGQLTVLGDQLAVLTGREPGAFDMLVATPAPIPQVPSSIAVGDPARLLRHRPDIRVAERQLAAANADLGARMADRLPKISFTGVLGIGGTTVGSPFNPSNLVALLVPQITWSPFDGGRGAAQVRAAKGARAEAEANYRTRVLSALGDAENALARFGAARIMLGKTGEAHAAAVQLARAQAQRAAGGTLSQGDALSADRTALRRQLDVVSAQAQLTSNFVAVEKALGLGWESEDLRK